MFELSKQELAECVGLWLAEGDKITKQEITFTNNCIELILFFDKIISSLYTGVNPFRLYVYSPSPRKLFNDFGKFKIRYYYDRRANRTYFIYRLADVRFVKFWHALVEKIKSQEEFYPDILRGIFAGEGNVKHSLKGNSRSVRIAQKKDLYLEEILTHLGILFSYNQSHKYYTITTSQLPKISLLKLTELKISLKRDIFLTTLILTKALKRFRFNN